MTPKGVDVSWQMENSESDDSDEFSDKTGREIAPNTGANATKFFKGD